MKLILNLSPVFSDKKTTASIMGTVLTINGTDYDLSELPDGATAQHPMLGTVVRQGVQYECTLILGHGLNAPYETRFPAPVVLENHAGAIELPPYEAMPKRENEVTA